MNVVLGAGAVDLANRMVRPICADFDAAVPNFSRAAFLPINGAGGDVVDIQFVDADDVSHVAVVTLISCSDLYDEGPLIHSCPQQQLNSSLVFPKPASAFALILALDSDATISSLKLQLTSPTH